MDEVNRYLQHVQNNPELDEFPMNNTTIRTQIAEYEVAYYKIRHTNPVLAEVDMNFNHSFPPVQVLLGEMTRLVNNITPTTNTTITTTATYTANRPHPKTHTDKDTISTTELYNNNNNNNNNNKTIDNTPKANDDKHITERAQETKRQHKQVIEREQAWHLNNNNKQI